jgi:hypothetical protein
MTPYDGLPVDCSGTEGKIPPTSIMLPIMTSTIKSAIVANPRKKLVLLLRRLNLFFLIYVYSKQEKGWF